MWTSHGTPQPAAPSAAESGSPLRPITVLASPSRVRTIRPARADRLAHRRRSDRTANFMWRGTITSRMRFNSIVRLMAGKHGGHKTFFSPKEVRSVSGYPAGPFQDHLVTPAFTTHLPP